jgi:Ca2+-binding RTX toxin-like protein
VRWRVGTGAAGLVAVALCVAVPGARADAAGAAGVAAACDGHRVTIVGTPGDDVIAGTDGPDVVAALAGDDVVLARGGDDVVCGGLGADRIEADAGDDRAFGETGGDVLFGGDGADLLDAGGSGSGAEDLVGGAGDDVLLVRDRPARVEPGPGRDDVRGLAAAGLDYSRAAGPVTVDLVAGTATGQGDDSLAGSPEQVVGTRFDDRLVADDTGVSLLGGPGNDEIEGGGGADVVLPGLGDDRVDAGAGIDAVVFEPFVAGVAVDLGAGRASGQGADTVAGFEQVIATERSDVIVGTAGPDLVNARGGGDRVWSLDGDDEVYCTGGCAVRAGAGDDVVFADSPRSRCDGGPGTDTIDCGRSVGLAGSPGEAAAPGAGSG